MSVPSHDCARCQGRDNYCDRCARQMVEIMTAQVSFDPASRQVARLTAQLNDEQRQTRELRSTVISLERQLETERANNRAGGIPQRLPRITPTVAVPTAVTTQPPLGDRFELIELE